MITKSFSTLAQDTVGFLGHHLLKLFVAIALPFTLALLVGWLAIAFLVNQFNGLKSWDQVVAFFSLGNSSMYVVLITAVVLLLLNVYGFIAGPLVTLDPAIPYRILFRRASKYVFSYLVLMLLVAIATLLIEVLSYLVITIIAILIGIYNIDLIAVWENNLATYLPNIALSIMTIFFLYAPYILIESGQGAWYALSTSASLVKRHFIGVTIRTVIIFTCLSVITFVLQFIPVVGYGLAFFVDTMVLTVYNYFVYRDIR